MRFLTVAPLVLLFCFGELGCARGPQSAGGVEVRGEQPESAIDSPSTVSAAGARAPVSSTAAGACTSSPAQPNHGAVLELFTSEGCSSCPKADALLADIVAGAERDRSPVYALAFHVDYWDHLGWKDAFSTPQYSARQRWYADRTAANGVYTPELVIGGSEFFVGSDRRRARSAIGRALAAPWDAAVSLSSDAQGHVAYQVVGGPRPAHLNLALVQRHAVSEVASGENSGSTLNHANVVRDFQRTDLGRETSGNWLPRLPTVQPLRVIAYLQDDRTLEIVGAASVMVPCAAVP